MRYFTDMRSILILFLILTACAAPPERAKVRVEESSASAQGGAFGTMVEETVPEYNRDEWGRWSDQDKDCQDTRQEVLILESIVPVTYTDEKHCRVKTGRWMDPYTGKLIESPEDLEIDHTVALREAHYAGGWRWPLEKKRRYFNDLANEHHLEAAGISVNRAKGARPPSEWLPPDATKRCAYLLRRLSVIIAWDLEFNMKTLFDLLLQECRS